MVAGLVLVIAATAGAFLTDDARYLRLAVLAAAWAFLAAVLLAGRHRSDPLPTAAEESRWAEDQDLARAHDELARLGDLRRDLASLADVRADLSEVRAELAALAELRADLGGLAELRAEVRRLRAELSEQPDGQMLVERVVMRPQGSRMPLDPERARGFDPERARGFDGSAVAARLDETLLPSSGPRTSAFSLHAPLPPPPTVHTPPSSSPLDRFADPAHSGPALAGPEPLLARPLWETPASAGPSPDRARPVPHRRRTDDTGAELLADPAEAVTTERRASAAVPPVAFRPSPGPVGVPLAGAPPAPDALADPLHDPLPGEPAGHVRLTEILAANAVIPAGTPRRRHRYREDDEPDDVLARVLGRD
jgi:hypothetical protein